MKIQVIIFYLMSFISVIGALIVVTAKSPMRCALSLMFTFLGLAGIYVLLHAHLLAVIQILVYAGGVTVLFAFVIMILRHGEHVSYKEPFMPVRILSIATVFYLIYLIGPIYFEVKKIKGAPYPSSDYGTVRIISEALFSQHVAVFEIAGLLILITVTAVVSIIGRSRTKLGLSAPNVSNSFEKSNDEVKDAMKESSMEKSSC